LQKGNPSRSFNLIRELSPGPFYEARVSFDEGRQIKEAEDHNEEFKMIFQEKTRTNKCFGTDGSKMEELSKIASTFTAKSLAIPETLEIIEKTDSEQNF
jgi:hypothetical protein